MLKNIFYIITNNNIKYIFFEVFNEFGKYL